MSQQPAERPWVLREFDLFRDLTDAEVDRIGDAAPMRQLPAGQLLYSPDRPTEVLFILKQGRIRLYRIGLDGRTITTAIVDPGQVFGEMAALGQQLEQTWAETLEPCVVCLMSRSDVQRLLLSDPRIAVRVAEFLGARVADLERRLGDMVLRPAPARVAATLARMGSDGAAIRLTHGQLADLVGTSRETTTKVLGDLADRGAISLRRGRVIIRSRRALAELADSESLSTAIGGSASR
jgi:CRP/FNR family transcriptional regulator, cyclic AMP receptor protein